MIRTTFKMFIILFILFLANGALATEIYINSSTGSDTTGNGSESNPYKTFHKGYTVASHGSILYLTGTWTNTDETGDIQTIGYMISKNIQIRGQGS